MLAVAAPLDLSEFDVSFASGLTVLMHLDIVGVTQADTHQTAYPRVLKLISPLIQIQACMKVLLVVYQPHTSVLELYKGFLDIWLIHLVMIFRNSLA